jgi:hypothetical protein
MTVDVYVTTRIPPQLLKSDIAGKGAAEIGWGSPGDFNRCLAFARRHGVPKHMQKGFCANLHKLATGEWPGVNAHKGAHALVLDYLVAAAGPTVDNMIRWEGPLALVGEPTGDRRQFPHNTLTYQSFPMPLRYQRQGLRGHEGAVTVGVIEHAEEKDHDGRRVVYGQGYFLDPDLVPEVREAVHLAEHGVIGPSVDLDSYTAVLSKTLSGEPVADMKRGRMRASTLVSVPAFANLRITIKRPDAALVASVEEFVVNPGGWARAPIAPREALFDADDAAKRIEAWANGDPNKMASMFLWIADSPNAPLIGRRGFRLPWGDIIDNKPYLIYHAVYAGAALLQHAHGGLPNIPEDQKAQLRTVITEIYQKLAEEFDDPNIIAPWDRGAEQVQQASGEDWQMVYDAALEQFRRTHRYREALHPRDKRKDDHAGEWIDTPNGPHGQIKVGGKWVYPPKRGEKGYRNPQKAAQGIAKRGGGRPASKRAGTRVAKKSPAAPVAVKKVKTTDDHVARLRTLNRQRQKRYLGGLSDEEINKINTKLDGTRLDDDTRDDTETEIIHRLGKTGEAEETARRKDEQIKERDRQVREIAHEGGKKTVIAKKKEPEKKAPEKKAPEKKAPEKKAPEEKVPEKKVPEKKVPEKKVPEKKAPETGGDDSDREELKQRRKELKQMETMIAESEDRGQDGSKRHEDLLNEKEQLLQDIDELEARIGGRDRKTPEKKAPEKKASGLERLMGGKLTDEEKEAGRKQAQERSKAPETKAPEKKTTVVRKKTGGAKEYTPNAAQQKALEDIRDGGKGHPGSRRVLEREGYVDSDGKLTQKGRDHLGVKETKEPEKKATGLERLAGGKLKDGKLGTKTPEKKTIVGKKAPREKKSGQEHADTIKDLKSREEVDAYLKGLTGPELRETLKAQDRKPEGRRVQELRDQIAGDWGMKHKLKEAKGPEVKAPEKKATVVKKATGGQKKSTEEHIKALGELESREAADKYLAEQKLTNAELRDIAKAQGKTGTSSMTKAQLTELVGRGARLKGYKKAVDTTFKTPEKKVPQKKTTVVKKTPAERDQERVDEALKKYRALADEKGVDEVLAGLQRRHLEKIARAEGLDVQKSETAESLKGLLRGTKAHNARSESFRREHVERVARLEAAKKQRAKDYAARGSGAKTFKPDNSQRRTPWWKQVRDDTGPEGVHAVDVDITPGASHTYVMKSGTLYRRDGVSYLVEDGDDMLAPSDVAEQFDKFHASLPEDLRHHQQAYVWVRGANPADPYWAEHYKMPGFESLATAGDGSVRVWKRGSDTVGPSRHSESLRHEFGHSISFGIGREQFERTGGIPLHDSASWLDAADRDPELRKLKPGDVVVARRHEGGPEDQFKLTPGDRKKKGFPLGVTEYGQNSAAEDFAEAVSLYTHEGPVGFTTRDGKRLPVYFRDLFPARARLLDDLFPKIAKAQRELTRQRGPL